jgi:hypothetical protein
MQDFSEPGLKDIESSKLPKSAEAAIERAGWGKEQRDGVAMYDVAIWQTSEDIREYPGDS